MRRPVKRQYDCRVRAAYIRALTANFEFGCETLQKSFILDELFHPFSEELLSTLLRFTPGVESAPQAVDLVLDVFSMR